MIPRDASRRRFLHAVGAGTLVLGAAAPGCAAPARNSATGPPARTRLVLLGTGGSPTWLDPNRTGTSTAIVYEDRVYLVDLGLGACERLARSSLVPGMSRGNLLGNVRGIFFTHLHSDHVADWPAVYLTGVWNSIGRTNPPVEVRGPGNRGSLPRTYPPGRPQPAVRNPEDPTPGITAMTQHLARAFAADLNDRVRDTASPGPDGLFRVRDIDLAGGWTVDPEGRPPRLDAPIPVWRDGDVRVTATLVDHHPTAPAFAFRFDTPDGSVVVSGDTTVSANLIDLARGADYLVHEVIDARFVDQVVSAVPPDNAGPLREHLLGSHTTIEQVGAQVAEPAGVRNLVLTHLIPANNPAERWEAAQRGFSGRLIVGADLRELDVIRA